MKDKYHVFFIEVYIEYFLHSSYSFLKEYQASLKLEEDREELTLLMKGIRNNSYESNSPEIVRRRQTGTYVQYVASFTEIIDFGGKKRGGNSFGLVLDSFLVNIKLC